MSKHKVKMTIEEVSAVLGLLYSVNELKSEVCTSPLRDRLEVIMEDNYPGYDAIPHFGDDYEGIEIYRD